MNDKSEHIITIDQVLDQDFDIVIVGGGMGGSTAAFALSKKGYSVLLIEKGTADLVNKHQSDIAVEIENPVDRIKYHHWPTKITSVVDNSESANFTPTGCGVGGSTRLYAGTLERLEPVDFLPQSMPDGSITDWPYGYNDLEPYYQQVEELFNVHGSADPLKESHNQKLKSPSELNSTDKQFYNMFKNSGLHPYRLHIALSKEQGQTKQQKYMGALEACVLPALKTGNLKIIENCEVININATADSITGVVVSILNKSYTISVKKLILAAGAFFTPVLLLRSISQTWPNGIANDNDLIGRNLMFHVSDFIGIWGKEKHPGIQPHKSIGFSDFYSYEGVKYGQFQSVGMSIEYGYILYFLRTRFQTTFWAKIPILNKIIRQLLRAPAYIASHLFKDASVFSSVIEDFPYHANRVIYDKSKPSDLYFIYNIPEELKGRVKKIRSLIKKKVDSKLVVIFNKGIVLNYGHPCGTCKAGINPKQSVVDSYCKVHGIKNLYVADASFMPTSGGTNPSLTIAANALRVVDGIIDKDKVKLKD
jgi:choline dehydrogenase-like flavoprotein